tara:strand:+ start:17472 stop:19238 length:1767 start_codon:yes stop_codon:yes gene_type:complete
MIGYNPNFISTDGSLIDKRLPLIENLQKIALENEAFRKVVYTGEHSQVIVMNLKANEILEKESHDNDLHFTFVEGTFTIRTFKCVNPGDLIECKDEVIESIVLSRNGEIVIPANTIYTVVSSIRGSKFIIRYSPAHYPYDLIQIKKSCIAYSQSSTGGKLPPFALKKHECLIRSLHSGVRLVDGKPSYPETTLCYGSHHIREILIIRGESTLEIDRLVNDSAEIRREILENQLRREIKSGNLHELDFFLKRVKDSNGRMGPETLLCNITLSPKLFTEVLHFIKTENISYEAPSIRKFIKFILYDCTMSNEYLANWGYFPRILQSMDEDDDGLDKELANYIAIKVFEMQKDVLMKYSSPSSQTYKNQIVNTDDAYMKIIKKGTLFYRGYKKYRGYIDKYRSFAWFGLEYVQSRLWNYAIPPQKEDNATYNKALLSEDDLENGANYMFDMSDDYCAAIGGIAVFRLKEDTTMLDFSDIVTVRYITNFMRSKNAPQKVIEAFTNNWRINEDGNSFIRSSLDSTDELVSEWICKNGFGGYLSLGVEGLHDELMICDVHNRTEYVGTYDLGEVASLHICNEPYNKVNLYINVW